MYSLEKEFLYQNRFLIPDDDSWQKICGMFQVSFMPAFKSFYWFFAQKKNPIVSFQNPLSFTRNQLYAV